MSPICSPSLSHPVRLSLTPPISHISRTELTSGLVILYDFFQYLVVNVRLSILVQNSLIIVDGSDPCLSLRHP